MGLTDEELGTIRMYVNQDFDYLAFTRREKKVDDFLISIVIYTIVKLHVSES